MHLIPNHSKARIPQQNRKRHLTTNHSKARFPRQAEDMHLITNQSRARSPQQNRKDTPASRPPASPPLSFPLFSAEDIQLIGAESKQTLIIPNTAQQNSHRSQPNLPRINPHDQRSRVLSTSAAHGTRFQRTPPFLYSPLILSTPHPLKTELNTYHPWLIPVAHTSSSSSHLRTHCILSTNYHQNRSSLTPTHSSNFPNSTPNSPSSSSTSPPKT